MKTCKECGITAPADTFAKRSAMCKICHNMYTRNHYQENKQYYSDKRKRQVDTVREWIREYKSNYPCKDCLGMFHYSQMDFDHLRDKEFNLGDKNKHTSIARVQKEIDKCELVCANCHRLRTFQRSNRLVIELS